MPALLINVFWKFLEIRCYLALLNLLLLDLFDFGYLLCSRAVTRGVNKGAKEDFRAAMERQVSRSDESFEPLLKAFLQNEKDSLLSWHKHDATT